MLRRRSACRCIAPAFCSALPVATHPPMSEWAAGKLEQQTPMSFQHSSKMKTYTFPSTMDWSSRRFHLIRRHLSTQSVVNIPSWIDTLRQQTKDAEKSISYDIKIYNELAFRRKAFLFDEKAWHPNAMSSLLKEKLCLGSEQKEYTIIGEAFPFPDRGDSPVINEPSSTGTLLWDQSSPTEKILIQLSDHFPPLLWISVKPTMEAVRKVYSEFLKADTQHMKTYLPYYESTLNKLETRHKEKFGQGLSQVSLKDEFTNDMRQKHPNELRLDWPNSHNFHLGTTEHFRLIEDKLMKENPFTFGWPLLLGEGNYHLAETPLRMAAFRTIFSKSLILVHCRVDLQLDHRQVKITEEDETDILLDIPVFVTVNYPENSRLCGGKALVERFNKVMGTSYPLTTPVDVLAAFARENTVKGVKEMRDEMLFLLAASEKVPDVERVVRLSQDLIGANRILGQLAYTVVYLALLEQSDWVTDVFERFQSHPSELIRVACAKGAAILMRPDFVQKLIDKEPEGRCKMLLQKSLVMPKPLEPQSHSPPPTSSE